MSAPRKIDTLSLPDAALQFAGNPRGILFLSGAAGSGRSTTAHALAAYVRAAGHTVTVISTGDQSAPRGLSSHWRQAGPGAVTRMVQEEAGKGTDVIVVDAAPTVDSLGAIVDAAASGAAVVATMPGTSTENAYSHLVDLVQAAQDWSGSLRRNFDTVLFAIIHQALTGSGAEMVLDTQVRHGQ